MAIQFDASKATMFRNVNFGNENAIANLNGNGGVKANGRFTLFGKFSRTDDQRADNNAVRTALLKALGQAFSLSGMSEEGGVLKFSQDFMSRLEQILGSKVFKRCDFEVGEDGLVRSGKPLTQRRITAIITKATMAYRTNFDLDIYRAKLDTIYKELGLAGKEGDALKVKLADKPALKMFVLANRGLDLLQNQLFLAHTVVDPKDDKPKTVYGPNNEQHDRSFIRVNQDYMFLKDCGMKTDGLTMYQVRDADGQMYRNYTKPERDNVIKKLLPGELYHFERAGSKDKTPEDMEKLKKYIFSTTQLIVQKMVDLYFECKAAGKLNAFMAHLADNPGACMEDKGLHLTQFEARHFKEESPNDPSLSAEQIAELDRIADMVVGDNVDKQIYGVIEELQKIDPKYKELDEWKDFAEPIKDKLVGKNATIMTFTMDEKRNQYKFEPLLDKRGQPVVRPLTEKDIDQMGPACLYNTLGY